MGHILVIDDDPDIIQIIRTVLEEKGHQVSEAATGEEGIARIADNPPDLIFLDIQMPGAGGLTVANDLAKRNSKIPFILCTGTVLDDPIEAYELYMVRHLYAGTIKKPMPLEDIIKLVDAGLKLGQKLKKENT